MTPSDSSYREISLTHGQIALVDREDFDRLMKFKWRATFDRKSGRYYARTHVGTEQGKAKTAYMHTMILGDPPIKGMTPDHIEISKTLDNRKSNLRWATRQEQLWNRLPSRRNRSGFKGVSFRKERGKYRAEISINGRMKHLGYRDTAESAYRDLYVPAALRLHGSFARL